MYMYVQKAILAQRDVFDITANVAFIKTAPKCFRFNALSKGGLMHLLFSSYQAAHHIHVITDL